MLVISYRMSAEYMCEFTSEEFCSGLEEIGVDSIEGLKAKLPALRNLMKDESAFREIYLYAFGFSRDRGQKSVALETAIAMWKLLFAPSSDWPLIDPFVE